MNQTCCMCKIVKDISMFYRDKNRINGRKTNCKVCSEVMNRNWRKNNPDKYSEYNCHPRRNKEMKLKSKMRSRQHRHDMTDRYIRDLMSMHTDLKPEDFPDKLVQMYKINLKLKRALKLTNKLKPVK